MKDSQRKAIHAKKKRKGVKKGYYVELYRDTGYIGGDVISQMDAESKEDAEYFKEGYKLDIKELKKKHPDENYKVRIVRDDSHLAGEDWY